MTTRNKILAGAAALAVAGGGWAWGSPWWTLRSIRNAAEAKDLDTLSSYVDYDALKADVKADIKAQMGPELAKQGGMLGGLGGLLGGAFIDGMVDKFVSPVGLAGLFAAADANKSKGEAGASPKPKADDFTIERAGLSEFKVLSTKGKGAMIFKRSGLGWKLSGVEMPGSSERAAPDEGKAGAPTI